MRSKIDMCTDLYITLCLVVLMITVTVGCTNETPNNTSQSTTQDRMNMSNTSTEGGSSEVAGSEEQMEPNLMGGQSEYEGGTEGGEQVAGVDGDPTSLQCMMGEGYSVGNRTFEEQTLSWGLEGVQGTLLSVADINGDGWPDLIVRRGGGRWGSGGRVANAGGWLGGAQRHHRCP